MTIDIVPKYRSRIKSLNEISGDNSRHGEERVMAVKVAKWAEVGEQGEKGNGPYATEFYFFATGYRLSGSELARFTAVFPPSAN